VQLPQTNIVYVDVPPAHWQKLAAALQENGIMASVGAPMRLVTHKDVSRQDMMHVIAVFARCIEAD
jgi:threonine aldolase